MSYLDGDTTADMQEWYERIRSWPQHKMLWNAPVADEIKQWAADMLPEGQWAIYDLYAPHMVDPMCIAICFANDALAVQFRLTFPDIEWWDREGFGDES